MITDVSQLRVEARALVSFGVERYEDAVVYAALRRYLLDVGGVPSAAWGTLPDVSGDLRKGWATALGARVDEAGAARDGLEQMADKILQAATDYVGADLELAVEFDLVNRDVTGYLPISEGYARAVHIRQGGDGVLPQPTYRRLPDDRPAPVFPPNNDRLNGIRHEELPTTRVVEAPIVISSDGDRLGISGGSTTIYENGEGDWLDQFVQEHRSTLLQLEALITQLSTDHRLPLNDLIVHAWRTAPKIIHNRADLMHSVANTYRELRTEMNQEVEQLQLHWEGTGVLAFRQYANAVGNYLAELEKQAQWLAEEGKKAADQLEGLRNAYAETGYERIGQLVQAVEEYWASVANRFSACANPEQALIQAIGAFVGALLKSEAHYVSALAELVRIDEQERAERPDLGSRAHDPIPFPRIEVDADAWSRWSHEYWRPSS
ncbi:hypothetical protein WEI85_21070 [Actinomycetes bacterium KLBMP 9797]